MEPIGGYYPSKGFLYSFDTKDFNSTPNFWIALQFHTQPLDLQVATLLLIYPS